MLFFNTTHLTVCEETETSAHQEQIRTCTKHKRPFNTESVQTAVSPGNFFVQN